MLRIQCFTHFLLSLLTVRTVNLQTLVLAFGTESKLESRYLSIQRFFADFAIDYTAIARFIFSLFFKETSRYCVVIDRKNWF